MENQLSQTERLRTALYEKMAAAQAEYRNWLLEQEPAEILHHTYEYTVREDILIAMEDCDLEPGQAQALLRCPDAMSAIFKDYERMETGYMEDIQYSIEYRAEREVEKRAKARKSISHEAER